LIQRAEGIAAAVVEGGEGVSEIDSGMTIGRERKGSDDRAVGTNVGLRETDAGQKTLQRGVAVAQEALPIETAAQFINYVW
jgi:hypothetical protein